MLLLRDNSAIATIATIAAACSEAIKQPPLLLLPVTRDVTSDVTSDVTGDAASDVVGGGQRTGDSIYWRLFKLQQVQHGRKEASN